MFGRMHRVGLSRRPMVAFPVSVVVLGWIPSMVIAKEFSRREMAFWETMYQTMSPGATIEWPKGGPHAWARTNADQLDPLIADVIESRTGLPWVHGLLGARVVAGIRTRDALSNRLDQVVTETNTAGASVAQDKCAQIAGIAKILAENFDDRPIAIINSLLRSGECDNASTVQLIEAARTVGNNESRNVLAGVRRRRLSEGTDRAAALAEKVLTARTAGRDILENADNDLREVTQAWVAALEAKDRDAYISVLPFDARAGLSKHDFDAELLGSPELPRILAALKGVAGREAFEIDRDKLEASMIVDGRYKFLYIFEVDGWKIHGPLQVAP